MLLTGSCNVNRKLILRVRKLADMSVTLGLFGVNHGVCATPDTAIRVSALAERLGYDSLWIGEHVVVPRPWAAPSPLAPSHPVLDPLTTLAFLAARTERVLLATGIVILPQRQPVVLAKQLSSLDVLSGGRLVFGMGIGYLEPEMRAVGVSMADRGARAVEYLKVMRSLWEDDAPAFHGQYVHFDGVDAHPRPVQRPLPVIVGGHSRAAHRRAARYGNGWYGWQLDRRETATHMESLRRAADEAGREFGELSIIVSPTESLDPEVVRDYAKLGVTRLVVVPRRDFVGSDVPLADIEDFVRANAPPRVGAEPLDLRP